MNPRRRKLLFTACFIIVGVVVAVMLGLRAFQENLLYFYSPSQIEAGEAPLTRAFRVGGLVEEGSVMRNPDSLLVQFVLTDTNENITVIYDGILPDLFREGQGIVANGKLQPDGNFMAFEVLAKHDENYMPPEVADALSKAGADIPDGKDYLKQ